MLYAYAVYTCCIRMSFALSSEHPSNCTVVYFMLHVDMNKSHMNIIMLHVDIIYLACREQKYQYATINLISYAQQVLSCSRLIRMHFPPCTMSYTTQTTTTRQPPAEWCRSRNRSRLAECSRDLMKSRFAELRAIYVPILCVK